MSGEVVERDFLVIEDPTYDIVEVMDAPPGDKGDPGGKGDKGDDGTDGVSFIWRGDWTAGTEYAVNDVVAYNGSAYICHHAHTAVTPPLGGPSDADWDTMVSKGAQGDPGAPGSAPQAYTHEQGNASASWLVEHNLGYVPGGITIVDSAGGRVGMPEVYVLDTNTLLFVFTVSFGGRAYLS